nr:type I-E CRISPR-associated protein Cas6/Cse3/CasE [Bacteroidota bacterium]
MYLHKISVDQEALNKEQTIYRDAYSLHQKIWALVSRDKNQKRNFLYRVEYDAYQKIKHIYLLAPHQVSSQNDIKVAVSPRYQPQIETGECLYFKLRANPVIKRKENGKAKEYSIIMDAKHQFKKNGQNYQEQFSLDELIYDVGMKWLIRKGEQHGFSVKQFEVRIDNDREYYVKPLGKQAFTLRTLDFEGNLKIVDADQFKKALFKGIGSAKSFGCGMMMIKRI